MATPSRHLRLGPHLVHRYLQAPQDIRLETPYILDIIQLRTDADATSAANSDTESH